MPDTTPPVAPVAFGQLPQSADCWLENIRRFVSRYPFLPLPDEDTLFQLAKGYHRPAMGEAATFPEFRAALEGYLLHCGVELGVAPAAYQAGHTYLQLLELDDFATLLAALHDADTANPWSCVVGENNAVLNPAQPWQHYVTLRAQDAATGLWTLYDPAHAWDGDQAEYAWPQLVAAIQANWDVKVVGYACKVVRA